MKRYDRLPAIVLVFPEVFKSVALALKKYMPDLMEGDMKIILFKQALCETERLVGLPAKDNFGPILSAKLETTERYVSMLISFYSSNSSLEEFERMEANDEFIDVAIESAVRQFCKRLGLSGGK